MDSVGVEADFLYSLSVPVVGVGSDVKLGGRAASTTCASRHHFPWAPAQRPPPLHVAVREIMPALLVGVAPGIRGWEESGCPANHPYHIHNGVVIRDIG